MDITDIIKARKTQKVLRDVDSPLDAKSDKELIDKLLEAANFAPYHYPCDPSHQNSLDSIVPWRCYIVEAEASRGLLSHFKEEGIDAGKIANMLACNQVLLLVTWLPEPSSTDDLFEGNLKNQEHIAAAASAIQNILITATALNKPNYWSSGGVLRQETILSRLDIPNSELLLGAVFIFPEDIAQNDVNIKAGAWRDKGKDTSGWSKQVQIKKG